MANYSSLKAAIEAAIKTNGNQEITGQVLQDVLTSIVSVIGANYTFAGVATPSTNPGTPDQNLTYLAMEGGTYTNFNGTVLPAGISLLMWNGTWTSETVMYGDGGVFDISVYKSSGGTLATYADLSAALDGGNNIPASARKGGMSVKYVQSSDNIYVQFRYMSSSTAVADFTNVANWQGIDDEPTAGSENLVKSRGVQQNCTIIRDIFYNKALNMQYNLIEANGWFVTDYIDVSDISVLEVNFGASPNLTYCACAYDTNKAPVDFFSYDSPVRDINVPANTKYFRFSFYYKGGYYAKNKSNGSLVYINNILPLQEFHCTINNLLNNNYVFGGTATPSTIPNILGKVFYIATEPGIYTNFGNLTLSNGINILSYNNVLWNNEVLVAFEDKPTANSDNLILSKSILQYCTVIDNVTFNKALNISGELIDADNWFVTDFCDVTGISVIEINFGENTNLTYCACAYDDSKELIDFFSYDSSTRDINIPANTKYFRFSFYHAGSYYAKNKSNGELVYNNVLLPVQKVYSDLKKENNNFGVLDFNVATYNVDKYFMFGYTDEQKTQYKNQIFPEYINQIKALFVFTQEDNIYANVNKEFWGNFFKYSYTPEDWWCGIYSKLPLIKTGVLELSPTHDWSDEYGYPDAYPRKYSWATTIINGKEVLLVSLHGGISSAQSREEEFQQLINFCADYDYVIMGGDTNHNAGGTSDTIFEMLHNAGYQTSNYGFWGGIDTYELNTPNAEKIDSIITKGFNLNSMDVISASIEWQDHHPVVSNINMEI